MSAAPCGHCQTCTCDPVELEREQQRLNDLADAINQDIAAGNWEPEKLLGYLLAEIVIQRRITDDGDTVTVETRDGSGETPALVELLGMLRMAEDTVMRHAMGEIPDGEDDE